MHACWMWTHLVDILLATHLCYRLLKICSYAELKQAVLPVENGHRVSAWTQAKYEYKRCLWGAFVGYHLAPSFLARSQNNSVVKAEPDHDLVKRLSIKKWVNIKVPWGVKDEALFYTEERSSVYVEKCHSVIIESYILPFLIQGWWRLISFSWYECQSEKGITGQSILIINVCCLIGCLTSELWSSQGLWWW